MVLVLSGRRFKPWLFGSAAGSTPDIELKMPTSWVLHNSDGYVRIDDQMLSLRSRHNYLWLMDDSEQVVGRAEIHGIRSELEILGVEYELGRKKPDDTLAVLKRGDDSLGSVRMQIGRTRGLEVDVPSFTDQRALAFLAVAAIASWRDLLSLTTFDVGRREHRIAGGGEGWFDGGGDSGGGGGGGGGD